VRRQPPLVHGRRVPRAYGPAIGQHAMRVASGWPKVSPRRWVSNDKQAAPRWWPTSIAASAAAAPAFTCRPLPAIDHSRVRSTVAAAASTAGVLHFD
jgi:hypothetical protein